MLTKLRSLFSRAPSDPALVAGDAHHPVDPDDDSLDRAHQRGRRSSLFSLRSTASARTAAAGDDARSTRSTQAPSFVTTASADPWSGPFPASPGTNEDEDENEAENEGEEEAERATLPPYRSRANSMRTVASSTRRTVRLGKSRPAPRAAPRAGVQPKKRDGPPQVPFRMPPLPRRTQQERDNQAGAIAAAGVGGAVVLMFLI